jgi:hypothetical protein
MRWLLFGIAGFVDFIRRPESKQLESTILELDLLPSSVVEWETHTPLGPFERAEVNHWTTRII